MRCTYTFILLMTLTIIQTIFSSDRIDDEENEYKFDEIRQNPSSSHYSLLPVRKQTDIAECLSKIQLSNVFNRDRRASISRPYFQHWRPARDNSRYSAKKSLAFSPRLGKRVYEDGNELDDVNLDTFLANFLNLLQEKKIDIVYEDPTKICLSQSISDTLIQQILDRTHAKRRDQDTEETRERQPIAKHPVLFRYRLG